METSQKQAYGDALAEYHPYFWASKMHFSSTGLPFYNFPYTFGYLLVLGSISKLLKRRVSKRPTSPYLLIQGG